MGEVNQCYFNETVDAYCFQNSYACIDDQFPQLQAVLLSCLCITSLVINGVLIAATVLSKSSGESVKILTINLGVTYIVFSVYAVPVWIMSVFYSKLIFPKYLCFFHPFIVMVTLTVAQWSLTVIAIDRCLTVLYPLRYPVEVTNTRVFICVALLWLVPALASLPPFFGWGKYCFKPRTMPLCGSSWKDDVSYSIFICFIGFIFPLSTIFYSYMRISLIARKLMRCNVHNFFNSVTRITTISDENTEIIVNRSTSPVRPQTKNNVTKGLKLLKIVLISVGVLVFCWTPYVITNIWHLFNKEEMLNYRLEFTVTLFTYCNCFINPLIFILLNKDHRSFVRKVFLHLRYRGNRVQIMNSFIEIHTADTTPIRQFNTWT